MSLLFFALALAALAPLLWLHQRANQPALPALPALRTWIRAHGITLVSAAVLAWLCGQPGMGWLMGLPLLLLPPLRLYHHRRVRHVPVLRDMAWRDSAIWLAALLGCGGALALHAWQARSEANQWVQAVQTFHTRQGRYPQARELPWSTLERTGPQYTPDARGGARLAYPGTLVKHWHWVYDFGQRRWQLETISDSP